MPITRPTPAPRVITRNDPIGVADKVTLVRYVDPSIDLVLGKIDGITTDVKFGRNGDIGTATAPEDMWAGGGEYTGHPVSFTPETVSVASASPNDTSAGTGARTLRILGLRASTSTAYESEDIILNGTTPVVSVNTWWRINRAYVLTAGSGGANAGIITINPTVTTASVFAKLPLGYNQTHIGAYTVPAKHKIIIKRLRVSITRATGADGSATISLRAREPGGVFRSRRIYELSTSGSTEASAFGGLLIGAGTDIKYRIEDVSDNGTVAEGEFEYLLLPE